MNLDLDKMTKLVHQLYLPVVAKAYGGPGVVAIRGVITGLKKLYKYFGPEQIKGTLVMLCPLQSEDIIDSIKPKLFDNPEFLAQDIANDLTEDLIVIQLKPNGDLLLWKSTDIDVNKLSQETPVYIYHDKTEVFIVQRATYQITNPSCVHFSVFAIPTFHELASALQDYKHRWIRTSQCKIFSGAWDGGEGSDRIFFKEKPELIIRKSLAQYLSIVLRNAEVRPEQIVDESHPVDIKITWMFSNRLALLEIKWLGKSINETRKITQNYTEARARSGASQLATYLDLNKTQAPTHQTLGYLVVIDARRRGLSETSVSITIAQGLWYDNKEIAYDPRYHEIRSDFAEPIRMFVEPICKAN